VRGGAAGERWLLPGLIAVALLFGGGGAPAPLPGLIVELAALAALVAALWLGPGDTPWPRRALVFAAALLALPLLQLVPLPPALWRALPGRATEAAALDLIGAGGRWMAWSVSPPRTLASLLALLVPAIALVLAARASPRRRRPALVAVAAIGGLGVVVGAAQLAGGDSGVLRFYAESHAGYLTGFQANRNAEADVLLIAMLALAALDAGAPQGSRPRRAVVWAGLALFGVGVLLTGSRAGIALGVAVAGGIVVWRARAVLQRPGARAKLALGFGAIAALASLLVGNDVARRMAARFAQGGDPRPELWTDTLYAIGQYWPLGSGLGTFVPVFVAAERLEVVDPSRPNRAHNDFLELALEAGAPGLALLASLAAWLAWRWASRMRGAGSPAERAELVFAGGTLALLALHSVVDYPLRSMSLAALAGVATGIILASGTRPRRRPPPDRVERGGT
jgi:O-antigen ligase